ncbi:MAG: VirB4 family type IV secretion/conjugal transfer ATPase [Phenylobacterium sp.]|uniref:VirB4 family type IV secretion/conjugal transfer ATPase n=1 Tax=Phenylobacterium sp. TaxID=1871053 RepID=UPI0027340D22|nr:VirB4 family type IV secretion/conjugal transfer ATPase [Phenylobacterium sp.]MDP3749262.1 VirB4 family type IV secretion/conjugal transfer ATPase [Phenylobacterium sp.]
MGPLDDQGERVAARERAAGDRLPYARHVDDRTLETRDGLLMSVLQLKGLPFETASSEDIDYRKAIRDATLRSIANSQFALYHHILRREVKVELKGAFPDPFSDALDRLWNGRLKARRLYTNALYLTVVRRPLQGRAGVLDGLVRGLLRPRADVQERALAMAKEVGELRAAADALVAALAPYGARVLQAYDTAAGPCSEPLEMLSSLYNHEARPVLLPECDLGRYLPYRRVSFGRETLELSAAGEAPRTFSAMVSIKEYPPQTAAGMLDDLLRLPCELTVTQSFAFVDRTATLERMNLSLRRMRSAEDEALSLRAELAAAKDDTAAGRAAFGEHHLTVMVSGSDFAELDDGVAEVRSSLAEIGVMSVREDVNLEAAYWAQFPGNFKDIARKALISTANFAGFASGHNFPEGRIGGNHWGSAVTVLETTAAGPYAFNFHNGDLGNFTVIGPSGSGKTVALNFLLAQARRFDPRIVFFDKDRGAEIFIRAVGGRYEILQPGRPSGMNPLQMADSPMARGFLTDLVRRLVAQPGEALGPAETARIKEAVDASFEQAPRLRRLRYFGELLRGGARPGEADLAARLRPWWGDGEHAWLFDNEIDTLDLSARTVGFDLTQILDDPTCRTPAMMYLFQRVEERLDGTPALIVVDEGWKALDDDVFVGRVRDWEKTIRKRNGVVGFCTQSAQDALQSRISSAIVEQSATHIFTANPKAREEDYCQGFGLTLRELDLIRTMPDTGHSLLIRHGADSVVCNLSLSGETDILTVLSGRERTVRLLDGLRADFGEDPEVWLPRLLERA